MFSPANPFRILLGTATFVAVLGWLSAQEDSTPPPATVSLDTAVALPVEAEGEASSEPSERESSGQIYFPISPGSAPTSRLERELGELPSESLQAVPVEMDLTLFPEDGTSSPDSTSLIDDSLPPIIPQPVPTNEGEEVEMEPTDFETDDEEEGFDLFTFFGDEEEEMAMEEADGEFGEVERLSEFGEPEAMPSADASNSDVADLLAELTGVDVSGEEGGAGDDLSEFAVEIDEEVEAEIAALVEEGDYTGAIQKMEDVNDLVKADPFLLRWRIFCLLKTEWYDLAKSASEELLELVPNDSYGHFYLAQSHAHLNQREEAITSLDRVINTESPASELVNTELSESIESADTPSGLSGSLSLALGYDTNAAFQPDSGPRLPGSGGSLFIAAQADAHLSILDQGILPVSAGIGGSIFESHHFQDTVDELDYTIASAYLHLGRNQAIFTKDVAFHTRIQGRKLLLGHEHFLRSIGTEFGASTEILPGVDVHVSHLWWHNDYDVLNGYPKFFERDGDEQQTRLGFSFDLPAKLARVDAGYIFHHETTENRFLSHDAHGAYANAFADLPFEIDLALGFHYGRPRYPGYAPYSNRSDNQYNFSASLSRELFMPNLTGSVNYSYERNLSTFDVADFDRSLLFFKLSYSF